MRILIAFLLLAVFLENVEAKRRKTQVNGKTEISWTGDNTWSSTEKEGVFEVPLTSYGDITYKSLIEVGTPGQKMEIIFDTGGASTWIPHLGCQSTQINKNKHLGNNLNVKSVKNNFDNPLSSNVKVYDPLSSKTAALTQDPFEVYRYEGIRFGQGRKFNDTISIGSFSNKLILKNATFGVMDSIMDCDKGVISLTLTYNDFFKSFIKQIHGQNLLKKQMFVMHLKKCEGARDKCQNNAGLVKFGDFDNKNCWPVREWAEVDKPETPMWKINSSTISLKIGNGNFNTFDKEYKHSTVFDSGSSYIHFPTLIHEKFVKLVGVKKIQGKWTIPCNKRIQLKINVKDGFDLELDERVLVLGKISKKRCLLAIADPKLFETMVLGNPIYQNYCITHDVEGRRVGFSEIKAN